MSKDFELVKAIVDRTNWTELRKHKKDLSGILTSPVHKHLTDDQDIAIAGVIGYIEDIQRLVVYLDFRTEAEVFGPPDKQPPKEGGS